MCVQGCVCVCPGVFVFPGCVCVCVCVCVSRGCTHLDPEADIPPVQLHVGMHTPCPITCQDTHPLPNCMLGYTPLPYYMLGYTPPWTDRHLEKHYFPATTVADGNYLIFDH